MSTVLIYDKDNNIRPGKLCKGKKCSMETAEFECKEDEKTIGAFHTHQTSPDLSVRNGEYICTYPMAIMHWQ